MSATPTTEAPVSKLVEAPPAVTEIFECADQNPSGFHCTTSSLSQLNVPSGTSGELMRIVRSAALRLATGPAKVTTTGCATPTTWPVAGSIVVTRAGVVTAAELALTDPT